MYRPIHTEQNYTAEYLGHRVHGGSRQKKTRKKSSEKRGRKPKEGRAIRKFKITLLPGVLQEHYLNVDLSFFNEVYMYTTSRLSERLKKSSDGLYHGYDVQRGQKTAVSHKRRGVVPHTPKYIMNSQNRLIKSQEWMRECTYQVSYRATVQAFEDAARPEHEKEFRLDGNTYEAKICYRLVNGFLYLKKFDQMIEIKETLPKGSLETIRITKQEEGKWTAVIEILEPYDRAEDIRESRKGMLETDTETAHLITLKSDRGILEEKASLFNTIANTVLKEDFRGGPLASKIQCYQNVYKATDTDIGLINMACVAAHARVYKYRKKGKAPKISKKYVALAEGFYIKGHILYLKKWGISLPINGKIRSRNLDYIVISKDEDGFWNVTGKKRKKRIFRNLSRIFREFSWRDNITF